MQSSARIFIRDSLVSENDKTRFQPGKVLGDIEKAAALRTEARYRGQT